MALLPEAEVQSSASWLIPLTTQRVATTDDKEVVGAGQIDGLLSAANLPFHNSLCVEVGDSSDSKPAYLHANRHHRHLVTITRVRSNRTFYRQGVSDQSKSRRGHPTWYGAIFSLADPTTWSAPDETATLNQLNQRGKAYQVQIQAWHNLLMRGQQQPVALPMQRYPFTLLRIVHVDGQGVPLHKHPLWLLVMGPRRNEVKLTQSYQAYRRRYDLEHFFRFGKQKLLLVDFQTPETQREQAWWQLVQVAYAQLWLARKVVAFLPRPWQRNLPTMQRRRISPTLVQRDFARIIRQLGTPALPPKRRGNSRGRPKGCKLPPRIRYKVVLKGRHKATFA